MDDQIKLKVAEKARQGKWIVGIDEAGRGPVIGPMVYAAAFCPVDFEDQLREMRMDDSKVLTPEKREAHFQTVTETPELGYVADAIPAHVISRRMLEEVPYSLNLIALDSTIRVLDKVVKLGVQIEHVYVDTVGPAATHQKRLEASFPDLKFTVVPKADSLYPIVSMASIVAKVLRDDEIKEIETKNKGAIGSGYPSDPITIQWLKQEMDPIFGFQSHVRFSWSTCSSLLDEKAVNVTWENKRKQTKLTDFMHQTPCQNRSQFFKRRKLQRLTPDASSHS